MRFSMLYSGEQILSFKSCLVFYAGDSLSNTKKKQRKFNITPYGENFHQLIDWDKI